MSPIMGAHAGGRALPDEPQGAGLVPTPSKFLSHRQRLIVELLAAGASRREASRKAGIDPRTLRRWLERGEKASRIAPESRFAVFAQAVREAEAGDPILVEIQRKWEDPDMAFLQKFIAPEFDLWRVQDKVHEPGDFPEPEPFEVEVRLSTGEPFVGVPVYDPTRKENL